MWTACHSCSRAFEVIDPDFWHDNDSACCPECGRGHSLDECQERKLDASLILARKSRLAARRQEAIEEADRLRDAAEARAAAAEAALERALAVLAEIESEAREKIIAPDTDAAQMVVSDAIAEVSARIAAALGRDGAR